MSSSVSQPVRFCLATSLAESNQNAISNLIATTIVPNSAPLDNDVIPNSAPTNNDVIPNSAPTNNDVIPNSAPTNNDVIPTEAQRSGGTCFFPELPQPYKFTMASSSESYRSRGYFNSPSYPSPDSTDSQTAGKLPAHPPAAPDRAPTPHTHKRPYPS